MSIKTTRPLLSSVCFAILAATAAANAANAAKQPKLATQFDFSSETTPDARKFYFETVPGHRYTLWRSTDLENWTALPGYPKPADGLSMEHTFTQGLKEFFSIEEHDDQAPEIVDQFPGTSGFAVRRFDDLRFLLSDASGIDPASIRLTVGSGAVLSVGSAGLTFVDNVLSYDSGDAALGAYGATVPVTLTVADTLGHSTNHSYSFTLEVQPKVATNLYVFGSPAAQRTGQRVPATPTATLAKPSGPVPMNGPDPWEISAVQADRVILVYTGATAPVFAAGSYLANLTPVTLSEVFYRKVASATDDAVNKRLTLMTEDVPLAEIAEEGSVSASSNSAVFDLGEDGGIQPAADIGFNMTFPRMGIDLDDEGPLALPGNPKFGVSLYEANAWVTPSLECAIETKGFSVQRAAIQSRTDIEGTLIPEITYRLAGDDEKKKEYSLHKPFRKLVMVGFIGLLPVWMDYSYSTKLKVEAEANAAVVLRFGWSRNASLSAGASYAKDSSPRLTWTSNSTVSPLVVEPVSLSLGGTVKAKASLVPQIDVRLESLLGFYVNADPRAEFEITADGGIYISGLDGKIQMSPGGHATLTGGFFGDLNAGLSIIGVDQDYLPAMEPLRIFSRGWELEFPDTPLAFTSPSAPQAVSVNLGDSLNLEGNASGGKGPVYYQWLFNGMLMPGRTSPQLSIPRCTAGNAGSYTLRARAGTLADLETVVSPAFNVTVTQPGAVPAGFALIPAGPFQMGDQSSPLLGESDEIPSHTVQVSEFLMGKYEVTKGEWDAVRAWGLGNGYPDLSAGNGVYASKGANYPVHSITWYDMVKWCNARSQKEGLTPCYTVSGATYKTGQSAPDCNWTANGYRLPTEAEWEKAARGGAVGKNFPWGTDTITHIQANFWNSGGEDYESGTTGPHPTYSASGFPYSSPVGSFAPNPYGLYDMAGNMWEWCWDRYGSYASGLQSDPRGASSGSNRVRRGGSWDGYAYGCRVSDRFNYDPGYFNDSFGFRVARSSIPQLQAGLVAYYPFEGNTNDASGNGNNGTLISGAFVDDRFGNPNSALRLSGEANMYTQGLSYDFDHSNSLSISVWANFSTLASAWYPCIASIFNQCGSWEAALVLDWQDHKTIKASVGNSCNELAPILLSPSPEANHWYHLVLTHDKGDLCFYVNGKLIGMTHYTSQYGFSSGSHYLRLGNPAWWGQFDGIIDDVVIYNRVLAPSDVTSLSQSLDAINRIVSDSQQNAVDGR